jgi:hypothetical protein
VIHYHGGPITPEAVGWRLWQRRHAFVSFAYPEQTATAAEAAQSFALDNGAFTLWKAGKGQVDIPAYATWVRVWMRHPGFDFCIIPDAIDGNEAENDRLIATWQQTGLLSIGVPVWHLHESFDRLKRLCRAYTRVALGSSGAFATVGTTDWWQRMSAAMDAVCDENGQPPCKLHGLRMLDPTIFSHLPLASADSTNIARSIGIDAKWDRSPYAPRSKDMRALILADRIEHHGSAARWQRTNGVEQNGELFA